MNKITTIIFDFGGVVVPLNFQNAIRSFENIGLKNASKILDPYTQGGFFGDVEIGKISDEEFRQQLSKVVGRELTWQECQKGYMGFVEGVSQENLKVLSRLKVEGYRLILLSNTNPFIMDWAMGPDFDGKGHSVRDYFDECYLSYECKLMKPAIALFQLMLKEQHKSPEECLFIDDGPKNIAAAAALGFNTYCPKSAYDWADKIEALLK